MKHALVDGHTPKIIQPGLVGLDEYQKLGGYESGGGAGMSWGGA